MKPQFHYNGFVYWVIFVYFSLKYSLKHRSSPFNTILKADVYRIIQSNWFCVHIIVQGVRGCVKIENWNFTNMQRGGHFCAPPYGLKPLLTPGVTYLHQKQKTHHYSLCCNTSMSLTKRSVTTSVSINHCYKCDLHAEMKYKSCAMYLNACMDYLCDFAHKWYT